MRESKRESLTACLAYFGLAVIMTWPLIARLGTHLPLGNADMWLNYWNLWWWKTALLEGRSPYFTDLIFFPDGAPLGLHTHSPANMLWTLPINVLFGIGPALNVAIFVGFVMAGLGGYLLAGLYTRNRFAAFLGGIACAYFPQHVDQATEHLNLASYWGMPLFLWAMVRSIRSGGRQWWIATGLFFALNALLSWHNALLAIPLGLVLALFETWRSQRPLSRVSLDLAGSVLLATVVLAPFFWPVLRDALAAAAALQKPFFDKPLDAAALLVPHPGHPLWGPLLTELHIQRRAYHSVGSIGYLGVVTLVLALCATLPRRRSRSPGSAAAVPVPRGAAAIWWLTFLLFLVLALGETLEASLFGSPVSLELPWSWLKHFEPFGLVRIPNRFLVPAMLSLAVLAAMGGDRLAERVAAKHVRFLTGMLSLAMLFDFAWLPFPLREPAKPEWLVELRAVSPPGAAILDIPFSHGPPGAFASYLQTEHGQPIVGGYIASSFRLSRQQLDRHPGLWTVRTPYRPVKADEFEGQLADSVRALGIGIAVVHLQQTEEHLRAASQALPTNEPNVFHRARLYEPKTGLPRRVMEKIRRDLSTAFGDPVYQSPEVEIYRISSSTESP